jgi:hypothetical protein
MERWSDGAMERWSDGAMERWSRGALGCWSGGAEAGRSARIEGLGFKIGSSCKVSRFFDYTEENLINGPSPRSLFGRGISISNRTGYLPDNRREGGLERVPAGGLCFIAWTSNRPVVVPVAHRIGLPRAERGIGGN